MTGKSSKAIQVNIRLSPEEAGLLKAEAARRGLSTVSSLARELVMGSLVLATPSTLILEAVLQLQFGVYEMAKRAAEGKPLSPQKIQSLQDSLELAGETLTQKFVARRNSKAKPVGSAG